MQFNGSDNISLFYFIFATSACKFIYSLVLPMHCKLPVARNQGFFHKPVCAAISSRHAYHHHKTKDIKKSFLSGNIPFSIFLCNRIQVPFFSNSSHQVETGMNN